MKYNHKIIGHIYETIDYHLFKFIPSNRPINSAHLQRLRRSFAKLFLFIPIFVTVDFYIVDGQHRFMVCKELGIPIRYIFIEGAKPTVMMRILNMTRLG